MDISIAIVVITYNRKQSLCRLLNSLDNAYYQKETPLYISIDKGDNQDVVDCAKAFAWKHGKKEVIEHDTNLGLRKHILSCGELLNQYDALVVLEDDIKVAQGYMNYVIAATNKYANEDDIAGISLYSFHINPHHIVPFFPQPSIYDTYFLCWAPSWGQVWLKKQWKEFIEWYSNNNEEFTIQPHLPELICSWGRNSWLKYHTKFAIENGKHFVYPYCSYSTNCGEAGEHTSENTSIYQVCLQSGIPQKFSFPNSLKDSVRYDAFFENEAIVIEGVDDICIDLNGLKKNRQNKRYWLTQKELPYKICKSYKLTFKPIEANIAEDNYGSDIFLYDTSLAGKVPAKNRRKLLYKHDIQNFLLLILDYSLGNVLFDILHTFKKKMKLLLRK